MLEPTSPDVPGFFADVKAYLGFGAAQTAALHELAPILAPHLRSVSEAFYARILAHPGAHASITGGAAQVERLKQTLVLWMGSGLQGPHDDAFYERRARIGRKHVEIGLPQQYMVTAVGAMRLDYREILAAHFADDRDGFLRAIDAVDRLFDLELAIMLQTYRIDSDDRLRRNERLVTLGLVAASIGHDLRNPLGVIESSAFILRRNLGDEHSQRHLEKIANQVRTCNRIVTSLLELARNRPIHRGEFDPAALFASALATVAVPDGIAVAVDIEPGLVLHVDGGLVEQVVSNLVGNAIQAIAGTGTIVVCARRAADEGMIEIAVLDDGPGFDPDILPRVFEPLVTGRSTGIGLGLAIVSSVAERHAGRVVAENRASGGAAVRLLLPSTTVEPS